MLDKLGLTRNRQPSHPGLSIEAVDLRLQVDDRDGTRRCEVFAADSPTQ